MIDYAADIVNRAMTHKLAGTFCSICGGVAGPESPELEQRHRLFVAVTETTEHMVAMGRKLSDGR